jgi:hypothetical protein
MSFSVIDAELSIIRADAIQRESLPRFIFSFPGLDSIRYFLVLSVAVAGGPHAQHNVRRPMIVVATSANDSPKSARKVSSAGH